MTVLDFKAVDIQGNEQSLAQYRGKVMLVVNTASKCGLTPQYEGLEALYSQYKDQGLVILGFPCNQFANQEKGNEAEIAKFCLKNYGVSFPMFSKIDVNGEGAHPLFKYLKQQAPGLLGSQRIKWNFTKFLVDQEGRVIKRFAPTEKPESFEGQIKALLSKAS